MSLQDAQHGEIFLALTITLDEAQSGGIRTLTLPDGREVTVSLPANIHANDVIRLSAQDFSTNNDQTPINLVLQISLSNATGSVAFANDANPARQTFAPANDELTRFPLILPTTQNSPDQPAHYSNSFANHESAALETASPVHFPVIPVTPIDLSAAQLTPSSNDATFFASELPTDRVPVVSINDAAASSLPADLVPVTPLDDDATRNISELPTDHIPVAPDTQTEAPAAFASSEVVLFDDTAAASPLAFPTSAPPPPFLPQPQRRKRLDTTAILSLCAAFLLLLLSAGGLVFDLVAYQPSQIQARTTATANAAPTFTAYAAQTQIAHSEQTSTAQQRATTTANQTIYTQATSGRPFVSDSLKHQSTSAWDEGQASDNASCTFKNGSYEVSMPETGYFLPCFAESSFFTDFAIQVDLNIRQGGSGGIYFRAGDSGGYVFDIDASGNYDFYTAANKTKSVLTGQTYSYQAAQANQLTIVITGNTFYFYLNQHFLDSTTDRTFGEGQLALIANDYQDTTTVDYNNFKVWLLP